MSQRNEHREGLTALACSLILGAGMSLTACDSGSSSPTAPTGDTAPPGTTASSSGNGSTSSTGSGSGTGSSALGPRCTGVSGQLCIGLNYYVFEDSSGNPIVDQATVLSNVASANTIWAQCKIAFQIETLQDVSATTYGVSVSSASGADEQTLWTDLESSTDFVILSYSGTVPSGADAWTEEGGTNASGPYGTIMDLSTDAYAPILAHELGHWLGLEDNSDTTNLMDLVVYASPATLTSAQCSTAVSVANQYWSAMLRT